MIFLLQLSAILAAAAFGGYICRKLNQPAVLGQLISGIIIGPSVLKIVSPTETFIHMSDLGVVLLMFIAGLETELDEMIKSGKSSLTIAIGGVVMPIILGIAASSLFGNSVTEGFFIGVILAATSVSITVETLREIDKLKTKQGMAILGAAVIDDVIGIILLSLVTGLVNPEESQSLIIVLVKLIVFFIVAFIVGLVIIRFSKKYFTLKNTSKNIAVIGLIFCLLLGYLAEEMGVAAITGAYLAGMILSATPFKTKISYSMQELSYMLLTPIFFVVTGMKVDISTMLSDLPFGITLLIAAVLGKIIGCGAVAKLMGFAKRESLQIGIGMVPRGEVALIVTDIGLKLGVVPNGLFASIIFMILVTTIVTPPFLKKSFEKVA
ncbi:cation:proton antiporter [Lutispora thermophila]|mgnify:CR=1 FL=1|uniref:Transporter, CPA2 family n=1 Tax=Lutispora thermophila DSM 19022 TaxID=1122184 RepID=A0A1M6AMH4_9FIRM|nr:cation:proton antiporter [Lutispora thermophila]SHI37700.1 transporter, CPA2 family [Lutispora thermophila DSM 19022]